MTNEFETTKANKHMTALGDVLTDKFKQYNYIFVVFKEQIKLEGGVMFDFCHCFIRKNNI